MVEEEVDRLGALAELRKMHNHMLNHEPGSESELEIGPTGLLIN